MSVIRFILVVSEVALSSSVSRLSVFEICAVTGTEKKIKRR